MEILYNFGLTKRIYLVDMAIFGFGKILCSIYLRNQLVKETTMGQKLNKNTFQII